MYKQNIYIMKNIQAQIQTLKNYNARITTSINKTKPSQSRNNLISLRNSNEGKIQTLLNKLNK